MFLRGGVNNSLIAEAANYSDEVKYGDYLFYRQVDEDEDGTYDYVEISDCDESIKEIIIPSEIEELPVTSIDEYAFAACESLIRVEIPDSVTSIGDDAFKDCWCLISVEIPSSVTSIGYEAFLECISLTSIEIPDSVTSIEDGAFEDCKSLTSIEIPSSVTSIGYSAFYNCSSLTSIDIPNSVTSIGWYAFQNCISLTSIDIPNSVTTIGDGAFAGCSSLTSIEIPSSVTSIRYSAFYNCSSLTNIEIPNNVTSIGICAFNECTSLISVTILNPDCSIFDNEDTISNGYDDHNTYYSGIIYGYENSTAQNYASKWGYKFESLGEKPIKNEIPGDVNGDGETTVADIVEMQKYLTKSKIIKKDMLKQLDLNNDGKFNVFDWIILKRKIINAVK